jgi:hypothetical protein
MQLEYILRIEGFEGLNLIFQKHSVNRLLDHLHVNNLNGNWCLGGLIPSFVHLTRETSPNFLTQSVTIVIDCFPGLTCFVSLDTS